MNTNQIKAVFLSGFLISMMLTGSANAASQCKGLENTACNSNNACSWVNEYERKDGRKVKGFCRTSSRGKAKAVTKETGSQEQKGS